MSIFEGFLLLFLFYLMSTVNTVGIAWFLFKLFRPAPTAAQQNKEDYEQMIEMLGYNPFKRNSHD